MISYLITLLVSLPIGSVAPRLVPSGPWARWLPVAPGAGTGSVRVPPLQMRHRGAHRAAWCWRQRSRSFTFTLLSGGCFYFRAGASSGAQVEEEERGGAPGLDHVSMSLLLVYYREGEGAVWSWRGATLLKALIIKVGWLFELEPDEIM